MTDLATNLQWLAMPVVAMIGIVVALYFSLRAERQEARRREAEHAQANARRDALLAQLVKSQDKADAEFRAIRDEMKALGDGLRADMNDMRTELRTEMNDMRTELRAELRGEVQGVRSEVQGVRDDLKAHEEKCERRWQRQAEEFGELRGILSALLQRTVERAQPRPD